MVVSERPRRLLEVPRGGREARPQEARQGAEAVHGRRTRRPWPSDLAAGGGNPPPRARALHHPRGAGARPRAPAPPTCRAPWPVPADPPPPAPTHYPAPPLSLPAPPP